MISERFYMMMKIKTRVRSNVYDALKAISVISKIKIAVVKVVTRYMTEFIIETYV